MEKNRKCDKCDRPATNRIFELHQGQKVVKYLCDLHAAEAGVVFKPKPVSELLTNFVKSHSGTPARDELICEHCGLTYSEFQERSLLGCAQCYGAFSEPLQTLLHRAHQGGEQHVGKIPRRAGATGEERQQQLLRLHKRLEEAVTAEDYELAAQLRDEIGSLEQTT